MLVTCLFQGSPEAIQSLTGKSTAVAKRLTGRSSCTINQHDANHLRIESPVSYVSMIVATIVLEALW